MLKLKVELGLFENPYVDPKFTEENVNQPETQELGLKASRESVVLLRNQDDLLPIDPSRVRRIAVIGPNAAFLQTGDYSPNAHNYYRTTILEGIRQHARKHRIQVEHVSGCDVDNFELREIAQGYLTDRNGNPGLWGRYYNGDFDGKPVFSRTDAEIGMSWFLWPPRHGAVNLTDADSFSVEWNGFLTPDTTVDGFLGFDAVNSESRATLYVDDEIFYPSKSEDVYVFSSKRNQTKPRLFKEQKPVSSFDMPNDYKGKRMFIAGSSFFFPMRFESGKAKNVRIVYHNVGVRGGARLIWNTVGSHGIQDAFNAASEADIAIVVVGDNSYVMGENRDRSSLELAGQQSALHS